MRLNIRYNKYETGLKMNLYIRIKYGDNEMKKDEIYMLHSSRKMCLSVLSF